MPFMVPLQIQGPIRNLNSVVIPVKVRFFFFTPT